jgi:tRNA pseudouridine55 synthase
MPVTLSMVSSLDNILEEMQGDIMLPVPIYSAIKKGGKRLYEKARNGEEVVPPKKEMHIEEMRCMGMEQHGTYVHADIEMRVSSGTYVRSIVEEIGRRLSVPATVASLRRTAIANISVRDSEKIDVGEYRSRISGNGK